MIRGIWDRETVAILLIAAVLPIAVIWLADGGWLAAGRLIAILLIALIWQLVFMLIRAQPPSIAVAIPTLAIAVMLPRELGVLPLVLGVSFGFVVAEFAFGGWGRNVLNPATVTLAFLGFGFPTAPWPDIAVAVGWAAIPAVVIGVFLGIISLRILISALLALAVSVALGLEITDLWTVILIGLVLLVCEPVTSATTGFGRWLNGLLYGGLTAMFLSYWADADPVQIVVSAALLASLSAPLLDEIAISIWLERRRRRFG